MSHRIRVRLHVRAVSRADADGFGESLLQQLVENELEARPSVDATDDVGFDVVLCYEGDELRTWLRGPPTLVRTGFLRRRRLQYRHAGEEDAAPFPLRTAVTRALTEVDEVLETLADGEGRMAGIVRVSAGFE